MSCWQRLASAGKSSSADSSSSFCFCIALLLSWTKIKGTRITALLQPMQDLLCWFCVLTKKTPSLAGTADSLNRAGYNPLFDPNMIAQQKVMNPFKNKSNHKPERRIIQTDHAQHRGGAGVFPGLNPDGLQNQSAHQLNDKDQHGPDTASPKPVKMADPCVYGLK